MESHSAKTVPQEIDQNISRNTMSATSKHVATEKEKALGLKRLGDLPLSFYLPVFLLVIGLALINTWEEVFFIGSTAASSPAGGEVHWLFILSKAISFLSCAFLASRNGSFEFGKISYFGLAACFLAASMCMLLSVAISSYAHVLMFAGAVLGGFGVGAITTKWFEICRYFNPYIVLIAFILSRLLALLFMLSCYSFSFEVLAGVSPLLPFAAFTCVAFAFRGMHTEQKAVSAPVGSYPAMKMLIALVLVFGLAFAFREPSLGNGIFQAGSYTAVGSAVVEILVLFVLLSQRPKHGLLLIFQIVLPLTAIAFLFLSSDLLFVRYLSEFCSAASDHLVSILIVIVIADIVHTQKASAARLSGLVLGIKFAAVFAGEASWLLLNSWGMGNAEIESFFNIVAAISIATVTVVFSYRGIFTALDINAFEGGVVSASDAAERDLYANTPLYQSIVRANGLTPREEEVLLLLLEGKSYKEIEDDLCISKETAKTHRQNIFRKCEVHSRDELMLLFQAR